MHFRDRPEISDLIVQYDLATLERIPVQREEALQKCFSWYARSVIASIPHNDGILCEATVDRMLLEAHQELQRLWEEFFHAQRIASILKTLVKSLRSMGIDRKIRVVDIGCGIGYVLRWVATYSSVSQDISLLGVDFNQTLISYAKELAKSEKLDVEFRVANAFELDVPVDIFISSGVLHHFPNDALERFFEQQAKCNPLAFAHFDPQYGWATPVGSFMFHFSRMRTPLARYDGFLSAARAHSGVVLEQTTQKCIKNLSLYRYNPPIPWLPLLRTMTGVIAIHPSVSSVFETEIQEVIQRFS